ncbi:MAG: PQQ-like beta-propeller repeat protein [Lentisphaeraceae bacterium]|nr:PQQ-like beta-propeller repeat protein [Lentisphaeraceae bacterium]
MKMKFTTKIAILTFLLLIGSSLAEEPSVLIKGGQENWPMSGGPFGNWQVKADKSVPTNWSVRSGKNILWKTSLPAGGQSGIAVWGTKAFLTINPLLDTKPYKISKKAYEIFSKKYETMFRSMVKSLQSDKDFLDLQSTRDITEKEWQQLLKSDKAYLKARGGHKRKLLQKMTKSAAGQNQVKAKRAYENFIRKQSDDLESIFQSMNAAKRDMDIRGSSADIVLICLDTDSGKILWQRPIKGKMASGYNYGFSDSTTACPATDGEFVWAINSSGGIACFTLAGDLVWEKTWMPTGGRPFNKQFDSILYGDLILNVEPPIAGDSERNPQWNYLHAYNKRTGKREWVTKDALTHYNAPVIGKNSDGKVAVMIARGGPHGVPERPVGLSMISLEGTDSGKALWQWQPAKDDNGSYGWGALTTQHWDKKHVSWFFGKGSTNHLTVDSTTGRTISELSLMNAQKFSYDKASKLFVQKEGKLSKLEGQRHCNILVADHVYFMARYEPFIVRHNVKTGETVLVEVPTQLTDTGEYLYQTEEVNDTLNSKGQMHGADNRTRGGGFQKCFLGSPTAVNGKIYFTNAIGLVYVIDTTTKDFSPKSVLAVNDLGKVGETFTVNSMSYAQGKIFHRTLKEVICIQEN